MTTSRTRLIALVASVTALSGCAEQNPFTSRQAMVGSLKTNVATLESENEQLRRQVANLKSDNRRAEEELAQEKAYSDDLATRLDNAKGLLSRNGGLDSSVDPPSPPSRSKRTSRKPPAASIPGRIEPDSGDQTSMNDERLWDKSSRVKVDEQWLPIAKGAGSTVKK